ncbi:MAG: hypothetical protein WD737_03225 [Gemmatimonadota bacterium]
MADIRVEKKSGGNLTAVWAVAAVVAILALMAWLFMTQETTTEVITEAAVDTTEVEEEASTVEAVELSAVGATPDAFAGREIRVDSVDVAAVLGNRGFWADVPGANPFLMILAPETGDPSWLNADATATFEGTVEEVTDAELDQWVQTQAIREQARDEASFATHYLRVTGVEQ